MTQEQVAAAAGITREYVSMLERDEYHITVDVLRRYCAAVGTPAWKVLKTLEEVEALPPSPPPRKDTSRKRPRAK